MTREEYIDFANALKNNYTIDFDMIPEFCDMAISSLSADVRPNTHGHWKVVSDAYGDNAYICECSECKDTVWVYKYAVRKWNYCPRCGAIMDAEPKG